MQEMYCKSYFRLDVFKKVSILDIVTNVEVIMINTCFFDYLLGHLLE